MKRRVWVRGVGAVTPAGLTWPATVDALAGGASYIAPITCFDATGFPCTYAATIALPVDRAAELDRRMAIARTAAIEAWREAALDTDPDRLGVFVGAEAGRPDFATIVAFAAKAGRGEVASLAPRVAPVVLSPAAIASVLAGELGARGPVSTISLACASGAAAVAEAARAIASGECDVALAGGVGCDVDPLMLASFGLLGALSSNGESCPFDIRRDGFVIGEGAAFVTLSIERGDARAHIAGIGRTLDAYRLTAPDPGGVGAARAMQAALDDAGLTTADYVQAHGTSTPLNDRAEAEAIQRVLGAGLDRARVSSVKGAIGHAIAGAGAIGVLCAIEAIARGRILPTAGLVEPDPRCSLPHVIGRAVMTDCGSALANSFAFGGANVSIAIGAA